MEYVWGGFYMNFDYPELYYRIYPKVIDTVSRYLDNNPKVENIPKEDMEKMIDEVYKNLVAECPEIGEDPMERRARGPRYRITNRPIYGRRRLARDIISIILLSELLRRINPYVYGYGPGYSEFYSTFY